MSLDRNEAIRKRLAQRLKRLGHAGDYAWLAAKTGESRGQVWKWATGDTKTFPASFAAALEEARVVSAQWLLTGDGPETPVSAPEEAAAFRRIAAIVDEVRLAEDVEDLGEPPGPGGDGGHGDGEGEVA